MFQDTSHNYIAIFYKKKDIKVYQSALYMQTAFISHQAKLFVQTFFIAIKHNNVNKNVSG